MNCEVESDLCLVATQSTLRYQHPKGTYVVFLRNLELKPAGESPLLSAQMTFNAPSLQESRKVGESYLREFLDFLTLITNNRFRIHRILQMFEWEPETDERSAIYYNDVANPSIPFAALNDDILKTLSDIQREDLSPLVRRAIKWFGNGVASRYSDDQFTFFWLAIEVLSEATKDTSLRPDICPRCKTPMYCPSCEETPLHRPYPKQAIQQLFRRHGGTGWEEIYRKADKVRNQLMHGEEVAAIEANLSIDLKIIVDQVGRLAWTSLISQFNRVFANGDRQALFCDTYANGGLSSGAHLQVSFKPNFDNPDPAHFPKIELNISIVEIAGHDKQS
jgi:hypothetical protein